MKILYIAPNTGHQIAYASAIYREMNDITILTDSLSFHLKDYLLQILRILSEKLK